MHKVRLSIFTKSSSCEIIDTKGIGVRNVGYVQGERGYRWSIAELVPKRMKLEMYKMRGGRMPRVEPCTTVCELVSVGYVSATRNVRRPRVKEEYDWDSKDPASENVSFTSLPVSEVRGYGSDRRYGLVKELIKGQE